MTRAIATMHGGRLLAAVLLSASLGTALLPGQATVPLDVHQIAQRVDHRYNHLHSLRAEFNESYDGLGVHRSESGTLLLEKPGRMRWNYSSPAGKVFVLDGKYAWFYRDGDPHVQRIPAKKLDDLRSPLRFLLGHTELEKEMVHLSASPTPGGEFKLTGQPKGQEDRITRLSLTVTSAGVITGIEIEEGDGAVTRFAFSGETENPPMPSGTFRFVPPPGVPIVDALPPV